MKAQIARELIIVFDKSHSLVPESPAPTFKARPKDIDS